MCHSFKHCFKSLSESEVYDLFAATRNLHHCQQLQGPFPMTGLLTGCDGGVVYNDVAFKLLPVINAMNLTSLRYLIALLIQFSKFHFLNFILEPCIYVIIYICFLVQTVNAPTPSGAKLVPASHSQTSLLLLLCSNSKTTSIILGRRVEKSRPTKSIPPLE